MPTTNRFGTSPALRFAAALLAIALASSPAFGQFTATVVGPPPKRVLKARPVAAEVMPRDTVRPTELSDLKAWVDSAAAALRSAPPPPPRDTAARPVSRAAPDTTARRPKRPSPPR